MLLAGVAAVFVAGSLEQEPAKHTMRGMKNGQVLKRDHFKTLGPECAGKICGLSCVQIVSRCEAFKPEVQEGSRRKNVGSVQAEVADPCGGRFPCTAGFSCLKSQRVQQTGGSHHDVTIES